MREMLEGLLPRILPIDIPYHLIAHEGKTDLDRSIPRKLRAWQTPGSRFIVLRDKDAADCRRVKRGLQRLCAGAGREDVLIRIVCHHLEAWFLGDLVAVEAAFKVRHLARLERRASLRNPDGLANAAQELKRLVPSYQKLHGARSIGLQLDPGRNRSHSFRVFVAGLNALVAAMAPVAE